MLFWHIGKSLKTGVRTTFQQRLWKIMCKQCFAFPWVIYEVIHGAEHVYSLYNLPTCTRGLMFCQQYSWISVTGEVGHIYDCVWQTHLLLANTGPCWMAANNQLAKCHMPSSMIDDNSGRWLVWVFSFIVPRPMGPLRGTLFLHWSSVCECVYS